jgi:adenylate cyclase
MVTDETRTMALAHGSDVVFRTLDRIIVKGRSKPVTVCEILGFQDRVTRTRKESIALFEQGLAAYWSQNWDEAIRLFTASEAGEEHPELNPSMIMLARAKVLKLSPPEEGWDGVYVMRSK